MCLRHLRELLGGSSFYSVRACKREGKGLKFARKLLAFHNTENQSFSIFHMNPVDL